MKSSSDKRVHYIFIAIALSAILLSAINAHDYSAWFGEILPILIGITVLTVIYKKFKFSNFAYLLMVFVVIIMVTGGHYTYGRVPIPDWLNDRLIKIFNFNRNHFDRIGHFYQGFTVALLTREVLLKKTRLKTDGWLYLICISITLAIGAFYELIEWAVALANGSSDGGVFVGAQGDNWDAQWDMFVALLGGNIALITLAKLQDRLLSGKSFNINAAAILQPSFKKDDKSKRLRN